MKKETREFFGLDEGSEVSQRQRWEDKRRRLASRKYGPLKDQTVSSSHRHHHALGVQPATRPAHHHHHHHYHHHHHHNTTQSFTNDFHALRDDVSISINTVKFG